MGKTVVIDGHPDLSHSHAGATILEDIKKDLYSLEIRHLGSLYKKFDINIKVEQVLLMKAKNIVIHFPLYWYSVPAILKHWLDLVFSYNFAYGSSGNKLEGKNMLLSITIGAEEEAYNSKGKNHFTMEELLVPLEQTAYFTGMNYCSPVYSYGMSYVEGIGNNIIKIQERSKIHSKTLLETIRFLEKQKS
ncbi:MAG: NAD(P)H-dependent oxidoreductase [Desulfovibrionaceae bacterium]